MDAGDAPGVRIARVEQRAIRIGERGAEPQQLAGHLALRARLTHLLEQLHGASCPYRPLPQQPTDDASLNIANDIRRAAHAELSGTTPANESTIDDRSASGTMSSSVMPLSCSGLKGWVTMPELAS